MLKLITNNEYKSLKKILNCYYEWYYSEESIIPPQQSPNELLDKIEVASLVNAKRGLQMAINDIVEMSFDWSPQRIAEADKRFAAAGTFTLTELRRRYSKKYQQILKRGVIHNETECYLVKGILDGGGVEMGTSEAAQLQNMLDAYENHILKKSQPSSLGGAPAHPNTKSNAK
jgi:hypothetical protein